MDERTKNTRCCPANVILLQKLKMKEYQTVPIYEGIGSVKNKNQKNKKMVDEIEKMHTHLPTDGEGCEGRPQGVHLDP